MPGFPLTERGTDRHDSIVSSHQLRMLALSLAVGVIAGLFITHVRFHLGLPGHKALLWMTPVILARLLGRCKAGATAGALSVAFSTFAIGGHLAGGVLGLPLIGFAGVVLDVVIHFLERFGAAGFQKWQTGCLMTIPIVGAAAMFANLLCLAKRLLLPAGPTAHFVFGASGFWLNLGCYALFGLIAGLVGATLACLIRYRQVRRGVR